MHKHTPGPWEFSEFSDRNLPRIVTFKRRHWEVGEASLDFGCALVFGNTDANVRLIAAAPDLLEAAETLDSIETRLDHGDKDASGWPHAMTALRAAIAKAIGAAS